ncbi:MAG TPA: cyclic nucleotide-binding domain-containing protein, partial [Gaiellaceae bacterium]|nr:cyclic nucleotide-binding domain-containing protein [Gaiellaceae bacterium]
DGSATVSVDGTEVRTLEAGDFFGELAILGDGRRTATVTTAAPCRVLVLFGTEFRRLEQEYPELAAQIESGLRATAAAA